jgi:multidrug efflux pump subunit AcrA (membrane-fusion protein)
MTAFGANGRRSRVQALVRASAVLVLAVSLTGCVPADTGLQRVAAGQLQQRVLSVTQAAAVNDYAAALQALDGLEAELVSATSKGQVSEERRRTIMTSLATVRADLTAAAAAAEAAAAKAAEEAAAAAAEAEKARAEAEASSEAAPDSAAPVPAPVPAPKPEPGPAQEQGKGSDGKAKGKKD